ncbi:MAG: hypothetical protein U0836_03990 [Pirellulales bacterium]
MLLTIGLLLAVAASAMAAEPPAVADLVVGERYEIRSGDVKPEQRFSGTLILRNDEWIVLETVWPGRAERGVLVEPGGVHLGRPFFTSRVYRHVAVGSTVVQHWIPAGKAQVIARLEPPTEPTEAEPQTLAPGSTAEAIWAIDGKLQNAQGKVAGLDATRMTLECKTHVVEERGVPYLSEVPVVGKWFSWKNSRTEQATYEIPRSDLICVIMLDGFFERVAAEAKEHQAKRR